MRVGEQLKEIWRQATGNGVIRAGERTRPMDVAAESRGSTEDTGAAGDPESGALSGKTFAEAYASESAQVC